MPLGIGPVLGPFGRVDLVHGSGVVWTVGGRAGMVYPWFPDCIGYLPFPELDGVVAWEHTRRGDGLRVGGMGAFTIGTVEVTTGVGDAAARPLPEVSVGAALPLLPICVVGRPPRGPDGTIRLPAAAGPPGEWLSRGRHEHASAAEFVRIARLLRALGAPPDLVARSMEAAEDEAEHAVLSYALAGSVVAGAMPVPRIRVRTREAALARLATLSVLDGVVGEETGACAGDAAAAAARDPGIAAIEVRIATDEHRHARLSGELLGWCLREGGAKTRAAAREAEPGR